MAGDNVHIRAPELVSRRRRLGDAFVTGVMWILYSYLWAPFISLIAWLLGFEFAYDVMVRAGGLQALREVLWWYGTVVACIFVVVAIWSMFNRQRYGGFERRRSGYAVSDEELAAYFGLCLEDLERLRSAEDMEIRLSEAGTLEAVYERYVLAEPTGEE